MIFTPSMLKRFGARALPFSDAASDGLPLGALLRLSLFQVSTGMATVMLLGTLNRVMIVELGVAAVIVAAMIALPVLSAPFRALLGFRTPHHAEAAALVPHAEVVLDPTLVTDALPADAGDVLACGPEPMLDAIERLVPGAQLAREAPMACGYGACYGCVVPRNGGYVRLCLEGPVLRAA